MMHSDLNEFKRKYDETKRELMNLNSRLMLQQQTEIQIQDENRIKGEIIQKVTHENEVARRKLEEERKRTEALLSQVGVE